MADSRAYELVKRAVNALSDLTGVAFWTDKSGDSDAKKVELVDLFKTDAVPEASTVDYQIVTPKSFAASVATTTRKGIVERATDTEVGSGTADKIPDTKQLKDADDAVKSYVGMRKRLFANVTNTGSATKQSGDLSVSAVKLSTGRYKVTHNMGSSAYFIVANTLASESTPSQIKIAGIYRNANYFIVDTSDDGTPNDAYFEFALIQYF